MKSHLDQDMNTEFFVMPIGLTISPLAFMDLINQVFNEYLDDFVIVFVYDILIYYDNEHIHEEHLTLTLEVLRKNKLYAKFSKCDEKSFIPKLHYFQG